MSNKQSRARTEECLCLQTWISSWELVPPCRLSGTNPSGLGSRTRTREPVIFQVLLWFGQESRRLQRLFHDDTFLMEMCWWPNHENLVIDHIEAKNAEGIFRLLSSTRTISEETKFMMGWQRWQCGWGTFCSHRMPLLGRLHTLGWIQGTLDKEVLPPWHKKGMQCWKPSLLVWKAVVSPHAITIPKEAVV